MSKVIHVSGKTRKAQGRAKIKNGKEGKKNKFF